MEWLNDNEIDKQKFKVLRLYAPEDELVLLDFYPLRESDEPDWNPMPEDWSCYPEPLTVYKQDYTQLLLKYFAVIYPTKDAWLYYRTHQGMGSIRHLSERDSVPVP